jgi:hypothetical protein
MSVLPDMGLPNTMSEAEYKALPAGVARRIEVVHGYVIVCESPTPQHQQVARRLANTSETARPKGSLKSRLLACRWRPTWCCGTSLPNLAL